MGARGYLPAAGSDRMLRFYDPFTRLLGVEKVHRRLIELAVILPGDRVLEIGSGTGNLSLLVKRLQAGADVIAIDPDRNALTRARRKASRAQLSVRFDQGFAQALPYADGSFDRVLSSLMLHHLPTVAKAEALREARRVLRPGASLYLVDFSGAGAGPHALLAHLLHHRHGSQPADSVLLQMHDAGLDGGTLVAQQRRIMGELSYYRASAPNPGASPD